MVTIVKDSIECSLISQEVLDLLHGHLADVEVLLVAEDGLEAPAALLVGVAEGEVGLLVVLQLALLPGLQEVLLDKKRDRAVSNVQFTSVQLTT